MSGDHVVEYDEKIRELLGLFVTTLTGFTERLHDITEAVEEQREVFTLLIGVLHNTVAINEKLVDAIEELLRPPVEEPRPWQHQDIDVKPAARAAIVIGEPSHELPATLFGFNFHHWYVQRDLWLKDTETTRPEIFDALSEFPGALYRYPGGLISNRFWWEEAVGAVADRGVQRMDKWAAPAPVLFGVEEYVAFVEAAGGVPIYTLNLVGRHVEELYHEEPAEVMAASNAALARLLKGRAKLYDLGNELDRSVYEWPHEKYIARARATMDAMLAVDPDARFAAFLRDFDWAYTDPARGKSKSADFIRDVLTALPEITDFSMFFYYDDPGMEGVWTKNIGRRFELIQNAMEVASRQRGGQALRVWITEHSRGINMGADGATKTRARFTSNLQGALSMADFLIGLAQLPDIRGAAMWGANATPWELFDKTIEHKDLRPRPTYWGLRVLRDLKLSVVLRTRTESPNGSGYGYDVRAVAFRDECGKELGLWAVNRSSSELPVTVSCAPWAGQAVTVGHAFVAGPPGMNAEVAVQQVKLVPVDAQATFSAQGDIELKLPPSSVSSFRISRRGW